jgi:hypothetical protein
MSVGLMVEGRAGSLDFGFGVFSIRVPRVLGLLSRGAVRKARLGPKKPKSGVDRLLIQ